MTIRDILETDPAPAAAAAGSRRAHPVLVILGSALLLLVVVRALVLQSFYVSSGSMRPTLSPGDRVLISKVGSAPSRGDLVVVDGTTAFDGPDLAPPRDAGLVGRTLSAVSSALGVDLGEKDQLLRVIGVGGDQVSCCTADGQVSVNGAPLAEPYLAPGTATDQRSFDVTVPTGRLWLLGDDRALADDSSRHTTAPGGGSVPAVDVVGRVILRFWPPSRLGALALAGPSRPLAAR